MLEILIELLGELIIELLPVILFEWGLEKRGDYSNRDVVTDKLLFFGSVFLVGALVGVGITSVLPQRIFPKPTLPDVSLIVSPMIAGYLMKLFGNWRLKKGYQPTDLASFFGGALFAFSIALVRWFMVG